MKYGKFCAATGELQSVLLTLISNEVVSYRRGESLCSAKNYVLNAKHS